jgi:hypothetical protein
MSELNIVDHHGATIPPEGQVAAPEDDNRRPVAWLGGTRSVIRIAEILADELVFFASGDQVFIYDQGAEPELTPVNINTLREIINTRLCGLRLVVRDSRHEIERHNLDIPRQGLLDVRAELMKVAHTGLPVVRALSPMQVDHIRQRLAQGENISSLAQIYSTTETEIRKLRST